MRHHFCVPRTIADTYITSVVNLILPEFAMDLGLQLDFYELGCRDLFISPQNAGESVHLGEMGAEFGALCRRFLLPSHPRSNSGQN
jgi:hypothetical protein